MSFLKYFSLVLVLTIPFASCDCPFVITMLEGESGAEEEDCAFTQGFWKNHPEDWPADTLELGTVTYSQEELLDIFHRPVKGNGLVSLAHQLIAAKLNVASGAFAGNIAGEIAGADAMIGSLVVPPVGGGHLPTSATSELVSALDHFNNHGECGDGDGPVCGNGVVEPGEQCDDGNTSDGDQCRSDCTLCPHPPVCGNGVVEEGEECDDGNTVDNDACSNACKVCIPLVG